MKFLSFLLVFLILVAETLTAQTEKFNQEIDHLLHLFHTIEVDKSIFDMSISSEKSGHALFSKSETTKKGEIIETIYEFDFIDLDISSIYFKASEDFWSVYIPTKHKQNVIKVTRDDSKLSFENTFVILAQDEVNAREIYKQIKFMIPIASAISESKLSFKDYDDGMNWLIENITSSKEGKTSIDQVVKKENSYPGNIIFTVTESSENSIIRFEYHLNVSNIHPDKVFIENKENNVLLRVGMMNNLKGIKKIVNGKFKSNISEFVIRCNNLIDAKNIQKVLIGCIPEAKTNFENSLPEKINLNKGIVELNTKLSEVTSGKERLQQFIEGDCVISLSKKYIGKKDKEKFTFNLIDLNRQDISLETNDDNVALRIHTIGNSNFIGHYKNNTQQNYTDHVLLHLNSLQDALFTKHLFQLMSIYCEEHITEVTNTFENLQTELVEIRRKRTQIKQKISRTNENIIEFTVNESSGGKTEELKYEFSLESLDPQMAIMTVSGKDVTVSAETILKKNVIQCSKNGVLDEPVNRIIFHCSSIENARNIHDILVGITGKK
jgi:hypothetical protein